MAVFVNTFFEKRAEQRLDLAELVDKAFTEAGIDYRIVGGLAAYCYVEEAEADAGRLTKDIDMVLRREDLPAIAQAVEPYGMVLRQVEGVHMLLRKDLPLGRRAVHFVFAGEKVRPEYEASAPELGEASVLRGLRLIPLEGLVKMKLTSFRLKDQMHIVDLDEVGLIKPEIEASLTPTLAARLAQARARG